MPRIALVLLAIYCLLSPLYAQEAQNAALLNLLGPNNQQLAEQVKMLEPQQKSELYQNPKSPHLVQDKQKDQIPTTNGFKNHGAETLSRIESMFYKQSIDEHPILNPLPNTQTIDASPILNPFPHNPVSKQINGKETSVQSVPVTEKGIQNQGPVTMSGVQENPEPLRQYGYDLFKQANTFEFNTSVGVVSSDYLLGPGDQLMIHIWGKIEKSQDIILDKQGRIYLPKVGYVYLAGATLTNATQIIKDSLSNYYTNFDVTLTIKQIRNIPVFVLGEVYQPGAYMITSLASTFHLLYTSGGPKKTGSFRNIKVIRNQTVVSNLDLYEYLLKGKSKSDIALQANDTVFIGPIGSVVQISGAVLRPAIYELKGNTSLWEVIGYAGGLLADSYAYHVQVSRVEAGKNRVLRDFSFSSQDDMERQLARVYLENGDQVKIFPIMDRLEEFVELQGEVKRPGRFSFQRGMTIQNLVYRAGGFKEGAYLDKIHVLRFQSESNQKIMDVDLTNPDMKPFELHSRDVVRVFSEYDVKGDRLVDIQGAIRKPGSYTLHQDMKVSDLLFIAQLETFSNRQFIEVFRRQNIGEPTVIVVNLDKVVAGEVPDLILENQDQVRVYDNYHSQVKRWVDLSGEVQRPGRYFIRDRETLSSVIERAGGYTKEAFLKGAILTRKEVYDMEIKGNIKILEDEKKRLIYDQTMLTSIAIDANSLSAINQSREAVLSILGEKLQQAKGRMIIDLKPNDQLKGTRHDIALESEDKLFVPKIPDTVYVLGGAQNQSAILYRENYAVREYIDEVGGYSKYADPGRTLIFKPNGTISRDLNVIGRGDSIYVPEEVKVSMNWMQFLTNIADILSKMVTAVAAVRILQ